MPPYAEGEPMRGNGGGFTGPKCGALTRRGTPCQGPAMANGRCRMHGGASPRGIEHPSFVSGRYSKSAPDRLVGRYAEALADPERHDLRDEIALAEAKIDDLLQGMAYGESDRLWIELLTLERKSRVAPPDKAAAYREEILRLIRDGGDESLAWRDVGDWMRAKQRAVEADVRVAQVKQHMMSAEEVMALVAGILDAIKRHVLDQATRSALARDIRALGTGEIIPIERAKERPEEPEEGPEGGA
jgi:hypothetical protein